MKRTGLVGVALIIVGIIALALLLPRMSHSPFRTEWATEPSTSPDAHEEVAVRSSPPRVRPGHTDAVRRTTEGQPSTSDGDRDRDHFLGLMLLLSTQRRGQAP